MVSEARSATKPIADGDRLAGFQGHYMAATDWTDAENGLIVADDFTMLSADTAGDVIGKASAAILKPGSGAPRLH